MRWLLGGQGTADLGHLRPGASNRNPGVCTEPSWLPSPRGCPAFPAPCQGPSGTRGRAGGPRLRRLPDPCPPGGGGRSQPRFTGVCSGRPVSSGLCRSNPRGAVASDHQLHSQGRQTGHRRRPSLGWRPPPAALAPQRLLGTCRWAPGVAGCVPAPTPEGPPNLQRTEPTWLSVLCRGTLWSHARSP